jgi:hypothetical protein
LMNGLQGSLKLTAQFLVRWSCQESAPNRSRPSRNQLWYQLIPVSSFKTSFGLVRDIGMCSCLGWPFSNFDFASSIMYSNVLHTHNVMIYLS